MKETKVRVREKLMTTWGAVERALDLYDLDDFDVHVGYERLELLGVAWSPENGGAWTPRLRRSDPKAFNAP